MREISIKDRFRPAVDTQGSGPTTSNFNERISKLTMKWQVEPQPRRQLSDENVCFPLVPRGMWCFPLHWVSCPHLSLPPFRFHLLSSALRWITFIHPLLTRHLSSFLTRLSETLPAGSDCSECGGLFLLVCFNVHVKEKYLISIAVFSLLIVVLSWDLNPLHFLSILLSLLWALTAFYWRWIRFFHLFAHQTNKVFSSVFFNN